MKRIGRLVLAWSWRVKWTVTRIPWTPFTPYAWRIVVGPLLVAWLVPNYDKPRRLTRGERRRIARQMAKRGSVTFHQEGPR